MSSQWFLGFLTTVFLVGFSVNFVVNWNEGGERIVESVPEFKTGLTISLLSIATEKDFLNCREGLFASVALQRDMPDEFLMAISGCSAECDASAQKWLASIKKQYPVLNGVAKIYTRPGKFIAGQNRNFVASKSTSDIISFMDGDDLPRMDRTAALRSLFESNSTFDVAIHKFKTQRTMPVEQWYDDKALMKPTQQTPYVKTVLQPRMQQAWIQANKSLSHVTKKFGFYMVKGLLGDWPEYHNAMITLKRSWWEKTKQCEHCHRFEDLEFNARLITGGAHYAFVPLYLGYYNQAHPRVWPLPFVSKLKHKLKVK